MKMSLNEQAAQMERINAIARQLVALTDKPEFGILSWWLMFAETMHQMDKEMVAGGSE